MRKTFEDDITMVFEGDGKRVVITRNEYNNSKFLHYSVFVKEGIKKGKTVATRCNLETAMSFTK